jgi:uncharacterized protein (TIGR02145 family)
MKHFLLAVVILFYSVIALAQVPNKMSFQTVARNNLGKLVSNKTIGVRLSILKTTSTGTAVFVETHSKTSNVNGLLTLEVGTGTVTIGTFATIDWSKGPYFLKTEMDVNGGANYSISGVTEFVSVPYAKMSDAVKTVANGANVGDMNYWNGTTWVPLNAGSEGQTLTFCGGKPTWTIGGLCPGTITALNCANATNNGTLTPTIAANGVTSVISYTGGNGGAHAGQVITSTGVTGLTATLQAGNFANGSGSLTYIISGTPATSGTASFALNIGGQICTLIINVSQPTSGYGPNISDNDGNTYKTVYIGTQQWMAENLKTAKYNDGTGIPNVTDNTQWLNLTTGAWCYYNNDATTNKKYGKLYNWYAVSQTTNGNKNLCPTGWHVPSNFEWKKIIDYLGGESVAGGKMKIVDDSSWIVFYNSSTNSNQNLNTTNSSLFSALPGGHRVAFDGSFTGIGASGEWWSLTNDIIGSFYLSHMNDNAIIDNATQPKLAKSIRCLKD